MASDYRNRLLRIAHVKARAAGLDDDTRRAFQETVTGKASLADMTTDEIRTVLSALDGKLGKNNVRSVLPNGPHTSKLRALWISGYWLGVVRRMEDAALASWICRMTGIDAARWATPAQTARCVEALKDWLARDGGVDWSPYLEAGSGKECPRARILEAQWRRLQGLGAIEATGPLTLVAWVEGFRRSPENYVYLTAGTQDQLIRELGKWLRGVEGQHGA